MDTGGRPLASGSGSVVDTTDYLAEELAALTLQESPLEEIEEENCFAGQVRADAVGGTDWAAREKKENGKEEKGERVEEVNTSLITPTASASSLGHAFATMCPRQAAWAARGLRRKRERSATPSGEEKGDKWEEGAAEDGKANYVLRGVQLTSLREANMARGVTFEERVVQTLRREGKVVIGAVGEGTTALRSASALRSEIEKSARNHVETHGQLDGLLFYAYEPELIPPKESLKQRWDIPRDHHVRFGKMKPDLLRVSYVGERGDGEGGVVEGHVVVRVIDVKASTILKPSHQVQIALYRTGLCAILDKEKRKVEKRERDGNEAEQDGGEDAIPPIHVIVDVFGEVWRPPDVIDTFDVTLAQLFLDTYMRRNYNLFCEAKEESRPSHELWDIEAIDKYLYTSRTPSGDCYKASTVVKHSRVAQESEWNLERCVVGDRQCSPTASSRVEVFD